jgi:stage V sporulation protein AB
MIRIAFFNIVEILIGFSGGIAVGGGFIAFLAILGIIPRLTQLSKTKKLLKVYGACVIIGSLFGTFLSFTSISWDQPYVLLIIWGGFHGIFNGMLAAALTEILNVFPLLSKRIGMKQYLLWFLMAIVFGKVCGSLFQWTIFVRQ